MSSFNDAAVQLDNGIQVLNFAGLDQAFTVSVAGWSARWSLPYPFMPLNAKPNSCVAPSTQPGKKFKLGETTKAQRLNLK